MKLTVPITLTATNSEKRTISGRVLTWGEQGNTSAGLTSFVQDSIKPKAVKLNLEHDLTRPIGRVVEMVSTPEGLDATFKIAETTAGTDALIEAASGLRDGFSVGVKVDEWSNQDGVLIIKQGEMAEVSLVTNPAIKSAMVSDVAANENSESEPKAEESETKTNQQEGDEVENTTTVQEASAETVEAAKSVTASNTPVFYSNPRSPIVTAGAYLEHSIRAKLGNEDSRQYVAAADDSFTTNPAFSPVAYVRDVATNTTGLRPVIDACGGTRPLAQAGMTVSIPKITANSTAATVAEGGDPTGTTQITSAYINATVIKKMGFQRYSVELLDRSDPSFYEIMLSNLRDAYAQATDAYVIAQITAGGTQATATGADSAGLISFVSTESPAVYSATKRLARAFTSGTSIWSTLLGATDTTGRPIYNAQPTTMNAGGTANPTSIRGNVLGLDYYVDANMVSTSIDESAFIIEPSSIEIFESPALTLSTNVPTTGEIELALYGYIAAGVTFAGGLRRFNLT